MAGFKLLNPDGNIPYSKIVQGRKWVGRVYPKSDGTFGAVLNGSNDHVSAATRIAAFELVVAKHYGYKSADELKQRNAQVRSANRAAKAEARAFSKAFMNASFEQQIAILDKMFKL